MQTHESAGDTLSEKRSATQGVHLQSYLLAALALGMAVSLLFHFGCLWVYGEVLVVEPDDKVLLIETVGVGLALMFSVYCLVDSLSRNEERTHARMSTYTGQLDTHRNQASR
jgi:hypothetical protein